MKFFSRLAGVASGSISTLLLSGCLTVAPATTSNNPAVTVDVARLISLKVGETAAIRLGSNPTTGYSWELETKSLGDVLSSAAKPAYTQDPVPDGTAGASGTETFILSAKKRGSRLVSFVYRAPWERKPRRKAVIEVDVL